MHNKIQREKENIECRPLWKPMHLQPVFEDAPFYGYGTSEKLFENGLCLPSGSNLSEEDLKIIVSKIKFVFNRQVGNSDKPEDWIVIPKEYVRTFNKQLNGEWLENGPYCGPTQKELEDMEKEYAQQRVREVMFANN